MELKRVNAHWKSGVCKLFEWVSDLRRFDFRKILFYIQWTFLMYKIYLAIKIDGKQEKVTYAFEKGCRLSLPCTFTLCILTQWRRAKLAPPIRSGGSLLMPPVVHGTFDKTLNRVCVERLNAWYVYVRIRKFPLCGTSVGVCFGGFVLNFAAYFRVVFADDYYQHLVSVDVLAVLNINPFANKHGIKFRWFR